MTFQYIVHLRAYQGLPVTRVLQFDQPDPVSELHTVALNITDRTLVAQIVAHPKAKAYEIVILKDPPLPGIYEFLLIYMGVEYPIEVELLPTEGGKQLQEKLIAAIKAVLIEAGLLGIVAVCAPTCADAYEIVIAALWPGVEFTLELVSQPAADPPEDQIELDIVQDNAPIAEFAVTSAVVLDQLVVTLKLSGAVTAGLPAAGDGPYLWRLTAPLTADPDGDVLLLARGHLVVERA